MRNEELENDLSSTICRFQIRTKLYQRSNFEETMATSQQEL